MKKAAWSVTSTSVHQVDHLSFPVGIGALEILQDLWIQLDSLSVQMGHAISELQERPEEGEDTADPGDREEEGSECKKNLGRYRKRTYFLLGVDVQEAGNAGLERPAHGISMTSPKFGLKIPCSPVTTG